MFKQMVTSLKMLLVLTVLTGIAYPLAITGISQIIFNHQANGSPIVKNRKIIGSELIGQNFDDPKYFWGRPSATSPAYNALSSSGSNLGPTNKALIDAVESRVKMFREADKGNASVIPSDLVMASGSGLDPHISVAAAKYQVSRIARLRKLPESELSLLVDQSAEGRSFGIWGQPRINVLKLNLTLDNYKPGDVSKMQTDTKIEDKVVTKASIF